MPVEKLELELEIDDRGAISTVKRFGRAVEEAMAPGPVDRQARAFQAIMDRLEPARVASERYKREHQQLVSAYVSGQIPMDRMRAATRALTAEYHGATAATTSWTASIGKWALGIATGYLSFQGLMMAVRAFAGFVRESIKASEEAYSVDTQLNATLARRGEMTARIKGAIEGYASALQKTTRFEDDAAKAAINRLLQMGAKQADLNRLLALSADVAIAKNTDLVSAADAVGRAATGRTRALAMLIGADADLAKSASETLALAQERLGGAAAADAETYAGKIVQLSNAWGNLQEEAGNWITQSEAVRSITAAVTGEVQRLTEWMANNEDATALADTSLRLLGATVSALGSMLGYALRHAATLLQPLYMLAGAADVAAQAFLMLNAARKGDLAALASASVGYAKAKEDLLRLAVEGNAVTRAGDAMIRSSFRLAGALFEEGAATRTATEQKADLNRVLSDGERLLEKYRTASGGAGNTAEDASDKLARFALSAGSLSLQLGRAESAVAQLQAAEKAGLLTHAEAAVAIEKQAQAVDALRARLAAASALAPEAYKALFATPMVQKPTVPVLEMPEMKPQNITVQTGFSFEQEAQAMAAALQAEADAAAQYQETLRQMDMESLVIYQGHLEAMQASTVDAQAAKMALLDQTNAEIEARTQEHNRRILEMTANAVGELGFSWAAGLLNLVATFEQAGMTIAAKWQATLSFLGSILGQIGAGLDAHSAKEFERNKNLQKASVVVNASAAIMAAWRGAMESSINPILGAAIAAGATVLILAQMAMQLSKINAQKYTPPSAKGFAQGTRYVPRTGYALLHKGEAVVPAREAAVLRGSEEVRISASVPPASPVIPPDAAAQRWTARDTDRLTNLRERVEIRAPERMEAPASSPALRLVPPPASQVNLSFASPNASLPVPVPAPWSPFPASLGPPGPAHSPGPPHYASAPRFAQPGAPPREAGPSSLVRVANTTHKRETNVTSNISLDFSNSWFDDPATRLKITDMVEETIRRGYRERFAS